ncbi:uncharacterized protein LOC144633311 [Oculina patagonica]
MATPPIPINALQSLQLVDPWSWETFLAPLNNGLKPQPSVRNLECNVYVSDGSLVERFRMNLSNQHSQTISQKNDAVGLARAEVERHLELSPNFGFEYFETLWKKYQTTSNIKSDLESSGSTWTIAMLEKYIQRQDIAFVRPESRFDLTHEALQKICERVDLSVKAIFGKKFSLATLLSLGPVYSLPNSTESDTRMILDAILQPLCVKKGLIVRSEQTIRCDKLPNNRYDYIMYYNDQPIGVVEAKRQGCLKDQSVAQLLVQLLLLSAEKPNWFYFGVLSDACQFIFAGVSRKSVVFFQANDHPIEIATVKSDNDLMSIVGKISWLADLAIRSRENLIENFLDSLVV